MNKKSQNEIFAACKAFPDSVLRMAMAANAEAARNSQRQANEHQRFAAFMSRELKRRKKA